MSKLPVRVPKLYTIILYLYYIDKDRVDTG